MNRNIHFQQAVLIRYIILLIVCMSTFFNGSGQDVMLQKKISIRKQNTALKEILEEITHASGFHFAYNNRKVNTDQVLDFWVEDVTLEKALQQLCEMTQLEYKLVENQIVLKRDRQSMKEKEMQCTISGFLRDHETGESLIGATIFVEELLAGTATNGYGFYSLTLPKGDYLLSFSYIGYLKQDKQIHLDGNLHLDHDLQVNKELLAPVTIYNHEKKERLKAPQMSEIKLYPKNLITMPEFGGEVGLIKSLQTFPGIKTHSDGSSFFFVRGGSRDQNLILIDEAPIFNPAHLFGYYSIIVPDITREIKIYKGDIPVSQGDRISSLIDIKTKDGNLKQYETHGMLNPLLYRFSFEGPIKKDKSSFFLSYRHSNFKWIYRWFVPDMNLYFGDVAAKLNFMLNKKNRLYFTFFYGVDNFTTQEDDAGGIRWDNFTYTLRWNHIFNDKLFSNTMVYFSSYEYKFFVLQNPLTWTSAIETFNLKWDFTYYSSPQTTVRFGFNQSLHGFNPGNLDVDLGDENYAGIYPAKGRKTALYVSREQDFSEKLSFKVGFRMPVWLNYGPTTVYLFDSNYNVSDTLVYASGEKYHRYVNIDPRLSLKYKTGENSSLKLSLGIYHQYLQVLSSSVSPFTPLEVWLPSGSNIKPQRSDQVSLGYQLFFGDRGFELNTEAYYKLMYNQIDYEPHGEILLNPLVEGELRFGKARSYGIECMFSKTKGRLTGWMSYTLSRVFQKVDGLNDNKEFPAYYDRPHDFSIYLSYQLSRLVNFSANWIYYSGSAITTPIGFYQFNEYSVPLYGEKNNDRLPDYHRLDVSLHMKLNRSDKKFEHYLILGIYNLYNRHNPISVNFNKVKTQNGQYVIPANYYGNNNILNTERYILGIMPSMTYKFKI